MHGRSFNGRITFKWRSMNAKRSFVSLRSHVLWTVQWLLTGHQWVVHCKANETKKRLSNGWLTIAELVQRSAKVSKTFSNVLQRLEIKRWRTLAWVRTCVHVQNFSPDLRSPPIPVDYRRPHNVLLALPQATMGDYQCFVKRHRTLTRTSSCDGPLMSLYMF
jgi:hypothetical protein